VRNVKNVVDTLYMCNLTPFMDLQGCLGGGGDGGGLIKQGLSGFLDLEMFHRSRQSVKPSTGTVPGPASYHRA